jgi:hypothetical protein
MAITFPDGTYYSCTDPECLTCTAPGEALEEYLDADIHPKMTVAEVVASIRARPITVTAYEPRKISDAQIGVWADGLVERLGEEFCEEHADPDGDGPDFPDDAEKIMHEAVRSIISRTHVWSCMEVGMVTLSPDQIEEVMREQCPEWFDESYRPAPLDGKGSEVKP